MLSVIFLIVLVLVFAPTVVVLTAKVINWGKRRVVKTYETTKDVFKGEVK